MSTRYLCIHGHFYQPPRENPWLEEVELQESAHPYHDWNRRISAECYAPNAAARIMDSDGNIRDIVNNYSLMSFDFGPTLLSWMARNDPDTYEAIIQSDVESRDNFGGHGSAIGQCYSHMIMPLANQNDKKTQVIWGVKDFIFRFGRNPEGMWLPETAADTQSLELLAKEGVRFTIMAPNQARAVRRIAGGDWQDVSGSRIDPRRPYLCNLPSGNSIAIFFYDGPVSQSIAFSDLLSAGENFAKRLAGLFQNTDEPQLVHISTDGETYGHHHHRGDMALAYALQNIRVNNWARITNYGQYLEMSPPEYEVAIFENSSWSCVHGVERWRNNCGCNSGMHHGWHQNWRRPLREAMDNLRERLITVFEKESLPYLRDCWAARDEYVDVILNRSRENVERFLQKHALRPLAPDEKVRVLKLFEMQRHAMLMFTSCGWFFDEVSGLENIQILRYASRAIQLAQEMGEKGVEAVFLDNLRRVPSNIVEYHHAAHVYEKFVKPSVLTLESVGAHYAVSSLFEEYPNSAKIHSYFAESQQYERQESGRRKLAVGKTLIRSEVTWEEVLVDFAVQHWGDHQITGGVRKFTRDKDFLGMRSQVKKSFRREDVLRFSRILQKHFPASHYSLQHLFKDEQIKVLYQILDETLNDVESYLRQINQHHHPIIKVVQQLNVPLPRMLSNTISVMLDTDILRALACDPIDFQRLEALVKEAVDSQMEVDRMTLAFIGRRRINSLMQDFLKRPRESGCLQAVEKVLDILAPLNLPFEFWTAQNIYFWVGQRIYQHMRLKAVNGDIRAQKWVKSFERLGWHFKVKIPF